MKLIERTTIYYLIYTLFIFALGTLLFYFLIRNVINNGIDEALHQEKVQIIENLKYESDFSDLKPTENVIIQRVGPLKETFDRYTTIEDFDTTGVRKKYRQLISVYRHDGIPYRITIRQSLDEADNLIQSLLPVEVILFLILLAGVLYLSRIISKEIWSPFYSLLDKLRDYNLTNSGIIAAANTNIDEFDDLGQSIEKMTQKIHNDYLNQKEFNENSSHELQTPLAIIRSKLELLIQSENLNENDLKLIGGIFEAVKRLSLLNKSLILLSKIDNLQYKDFEKVVINEIQRSIVQNFEETLEQKEIKLQLVEAETCVVVANIHLIEILLNNLFSNAVKHNIKGGFISIEIEEKSLTISNSGNPIEGNTEQLFQRFVKQSSSENSIGLGLSIVKKICEISSIQIDYSVQSNTHTLTLTF